MAWYLYEKMFDSFNRCYYIEVPEKNDIEVPDPTHRDLNSKLVQFSNGPKQFVCPMVRY